MEKKVGIPYEGFAEYCRTVAAQGAVLIQNEGQVLPLAKGEKVAVFGRCQINYYRNGTGSGGAVHVPYSTTLIQGLRDSKSVQVNETLAAVYAEWVKENPFDDGGGGWAAEPWNQKEMPLSDEVVQAAGKESDKAVIVIGRTAGEAQDNADTEGSYRLTADELAMLRMVTTYFKQTVVVLNVSAIIDMSWVKGNYVNPISAVIYSWHGGMEGGNAIADVLTGKVTPSGKLSDSIADCMASYPTTEGYGDEVRCYYKEDIYVGYRYFETFAPEHVVYEFGHGLSYTTFSIAAGAASIKDRIITVPVKVTNTGEMYSGKEVVQLYVSAPQGALGKAAKVLAGFVKTKELAPGESQTFTMEIPMSRFASYDDSGVTGHKSCYVLEAGEYVFYVGSSIRKVKEVFFADSMRPSMYLPELIVLEQLSEAMAPTEQFEILKPGAKKEDGTFEPTYIPVANQKIVLKERIDQNRPESLPITGNKGITLEDVAASRADMKDFIAQLSAEQLAQLVRGEGMSNPLVTPGTASAFGGVTKELHDYGIPLACTADGPSGIRMESGFMSTQMPIGVLLACTWDPELVEALHVFTGKELLRNEVDALLGPGMNLHRSPMNGRNFEYYSEDPLITGQMAAAATRGIRKGGSFATLKHFACNNQEKARCELDAAVSERAIRELYLKGFEIAVKEGGAKSIMTSYNSVNGHWSASNYDLNTTVLRGEWGYDGMVMTDWWASMNDVYTGGESGRDQTGSMVCAQNDVYMVVSNGGAQSNISKDDTLSALEEGRITLGDLQRNAMNICNFLIHTPVFARKPAYGGEPVRPVAETKQPAGVASVTLKEQAVLSYDNMEQHFCLFVPESGTYEMQVVINSPAEIIAQAAFHILMNGKFLSVVQCGGTDGKPFTMRLNNAVMEAGYYEVSINNTRPGLQLESLQFSRI